jgi:hypothetical protein
MKFTTLGETEKYISVGKTEGRKALGRSRHVLEDVGRVNLRIFVWPVTVNVT